ncbi:TetR/AcrR family transcriptional regulator C-terminal domain-containing protein [Streptomyces sp. NPDC057621]|uniref:TetR/AcrR family transcriptional regulator C-terminal domain-containing protein n=1 Tax=Streptomyces sp. NPDC057621 TaxID=3346186 RepID=UPI0036BDDB1E
MQRAALTLEHVVRSAVAVLDSDGMDGLSMRHLGQRLGATATALYWHVENREDLIRLASDHVWGEAELPDVGTADWRATAVVMANNLHATLNRHPWLIQAVGASPVCGPNRSRYDDHHIAVYEAAGFARDQADRAAFAVSAYVLGAALKAATATPGAWRSVHGAPRRRQDAPQRDTADCVPGRSTQPAVPVGAPELPEGYSCGLQALLDGLASGLAGH